MNDTLQRKEHFPWWRRIKLRVLVFGILMSILPLAILGLASFNAARSYLQRSIQEQNFERAHILAGQIETFMTNMADSLSQVTSTNAYTLVGNNQIERQVILGTLLREEPYFETLEVAGIYYNVLDKASRREVVFPAVPGQKLENLAFTADRPFSLSGVFFSNDGRPQVYLTVGILDPQTRKILGYLQAKTDLKSLVTQFANLQIGKAGIAYLTDEKGNLIGHTDFSRVLAQENVRTNQAVQNFLAGNAPTRQGSEYVNREGIRVIGMYAPVGTLGWGVFIEQSVSEAYGPVQQFALRVLAIIFFGILAVTLISIIFGLKLTRPIENLEAGVRRIINTGDLLAEIPQESHDEIGHLVLAFNKLLRQLQEKNQNLKAEQDLLKTVVNGIGAGMVLVNQEKQILWWNSIFADWFGNYDLRNLYCERILGEEGMDCFFRENGKVVPLDVNGERRYIRQMYYGINPGNSENAAYLLLLEDVTQQAEMEARVIEAEKLASVGLLASGIAHEINNPLAIVSAHSEELLDRMQEENEVPDFHEIQGILKIVTQQIERCKQITGRLLHFARRGKQGNDLLDAGIAIEQTLALLAQRAKQKRLTFRHEIEPGLWILSNENEWQQVLLNILTNAIDASQEGKSIEVYVERKNSSIEVEVRDHGEGIPSQNLHRVFDPFFTTKPVGQGTGLGLFVSYGIIQKMRGQISIESQEGEGTTVRMTIPAYEGVQG